MKIKKYMIIALVALLVTTSLANISSARLIGKLSNDTEVKDTGEIQSLKISASTLEKPNYIIKGDQGTMFLGRLYTRYYPLDLPEEFRHDGIKVEFTGEIAIKDFLSVRSILIFLKYRALPIKLKTIYELDPHHEVNLAFDIMVKTNHKFGDPIPVVANLLNKGEHEVQVSEMALEVLTLNLDIITPDGTTLTFNESRRHRRNPNVILIKAKQVYSVTIEDITDPGLFIDEDLKNHDFKTGNYSVQGYYYCGEYCPSETTLNVFVGDFNSSIYPFAIKDEIPENIPPVSIIAAPLICNTYEEIYLDGTNSYDTDGTIEKWRWSYTNGENFPAVIGDAETLNHTFIKEGIYHLELQVTDDKGAKNTSYSDLIVNGLPGPENATLFGVVKGNLGLTSSDGIPLFKAEVTAQLILPNDEISSEDKYVTTTNLKGEYELNVEAGKYLVTARKEGFRSEETFVGLEPKVQKEQNFVLRKISAKFLFSISMDNLGSHAASSLPVTATLTNNGESTEKVSEMLLEVGSLDFVIITPDLNKIHYIGPIIKRYPYVVELKPGESIEVVVDLMSEEFGNEKGTYNLRTSGQYSILGIYHSKGPIFGDEGRWNGILTSNLLRFEVLETIP